jgi:signal transduction histidine kinase
MRARDRFARLLGSWRADAVLAAGMALGTVLYVAAQGLLHGANNVLETGCGIAIIGCIVPRRSHPRLAALAAGGLLALASAGNINPVPTSPPMVAIFLLGYSLGTADGLGWSVLALAGLGLGTQLANGITVFNPFIVVGTIGPFGLGLVMRSRRALTSQLAARGAELEAERELFAAEAVRYERARIARELHDIVAHCISVMVIQASAGHRLAGQDPALAAEAFDAISEAVGQAESEVGRLVELLEHDRGMRGLDGIRLVDELVARAGAAGLAVTCRLHGPADGMPQQASEAAYRVVQESLTNALKHAPGAPVDVAIAEAGGRFEVSVTNGPPAAAPSGLELTGGGRGLAGMRERVLACGGELTAGPLGDGGWRVLASLPRTPRQAPACPGVSPVPGSPG